jgi:hypothetical protein
MLLPLCKRDVHLPFQFTSIAASSARFRKKRTCLLVWCSWSLRRTCLCFVPVRCSFWKEVFVLPPHAQLLPHVSVLQVFKCMHGFSLIWKKISVLLSTYLRVFSLPVWEGSIFPIYPSSTAAGF